MLRHLPKKVANFLHNYHADQSTSLALALLPSDRINIDVHSMLRPIDIAFLLRRLSLQQAMRDMGHLHLKLDIQCILDSSVCSAGLFQNCGAMAAERISCSFGHLVTVLRPLS